MSVLNGRRDKIGHGYGLTKLDPGPQFSTVFISVEPKWRSRLSAPR